MAGRIYFLKEDSKLLAMEEATYDSPLSLLGQSSSSWGT